MKKFFYILLAIFTTVNFTFAQTVIKDSDLEGGQTYTWTKDNVYMIDGFVFLEAGGVLNIEAGTVIKAKEVPTTSDNASALIISRGATINAIGTETEPIIFTCEIDDVNDDADLDDTDKGLWGGLIVLGNGIIGNATPETGVEGIPAGETRALFGGNDDADNSGTLKYVSIRHGGAELAPGDEINGLTLGAVGSGTVIENIEVFANSDDGIEFFGGAVNVKGAAVAFCGDDSFDWDLGWQGNGQFWFSIQSEDDGDNGAEMDGAKPDDNARFSNPIIRNATYVGSGAGASAKNEHALLFRDGTAGTYINSIFTGFKDKGIQVEDLDNGLDSRQRMEDGELVLANNIWWNIGNNTTIEDFINPTTAGGDVSWLVSHLAGNDNTAEDPGYVIDRLPDGNLNLIPGAAAYENVRGGISESSWFTATLYKGAFSDDGSWMVGWTALSQYGFMSDAVGFAPLDSDSVSGINDILSEENGFVLAPNTPNPASDATNFNFTLPKAATVSLSIFDATGKFVTHVLDNERLAEGDYTERFETNNLSNGLYFYSLRTGEVVLTKRFVVKK